MKLSTKQLTTMGILAALSVVLVFLIHFPIFPQAAFLEYDPADIPIILGTFALGPIPGILITVAASLVQGFTVSAQSGPYGIIMHIISTGTFVLSAGLIYRYSKTIKGALVGLLSGVLATTVIMALANLIITPLFMGVSVDVVKGMLFPVIIPFNLIKMGVNAAISFVVYKPVSKILVRLGVK